MKYSKLFAGAFVGGLILSVAVPAFGQKKIKDLKYPPVSTLEVPQPEQITLDNGMRVYLLEDHTLPLVNLSARLAGGAYLEPASLVGLAGITGSVMRTGGTKSMTGDQIDEELESIGASVEAGIGAVSGSASAHALSEYSETVVRVLADVLRRPVFNQDKIDLAKTEERSSISRRNDDPFQINIREFKKLLYGAESPYARSTEYSTIDAIKRDDLVAFHRTFVHPNGTQLAVWGDFDKAAMTELIKKYFSDWEKGQIEIPKPPEVNYQFVPSVNYAEKTDVNQSNIFIGHIGGKIGDPDYAATEVMNSILGGAFGSRLFNEVRSRLGLAYAVSGTYTFDYDKPGFFYVFCSTKSGSTVQAIRECVEEIRKMQTDLPTPNEMKLAKDGYLNSFVFYFDTKDEVINRLMTYDYYGLPADYLQQIKAKIEKVTPEDVLAVAKLKLNPDALQIMVTGNGAEFDTSLSVLGSVNTIDITIPAPTEDAFSATDEEIAQGMEILHKAVEASGGAKNFQKIECVQTSAKITMTMAQGSMAADATSLVVFPDRSRQVVTLPFGEQVAVYVGGAGWTSMAGQQKAMSSGEAAEAAADLERDLVWVLKSASQPTYKVAFKGEEDFVDTKALRLDFLTSGGSQFKLYVDPSTNLPVGMRYMGQTMAGISQVTERYRDHKKAAGIMVPGKINREGGGMTIDIEVVKADVNATYDTALFQKPDSL
jgi:predicted Zn-dependent peptidase